MLLTNRIRGILLLLMDAEGPLKEDDIADQVGVSRRTVQREVEYLDGALREYGLLLHRKKGVGISVTGSEQAKERLRGELEEKEAGEPTDVAGRRNRLLFELIRDKAPRKIYYYSQLLGVSEATVNKDMSALGPWLEQNHLKLVKRQGFGVALSGSERDLRAAMRRYVSENMSVPWAGIEGLKESAAGALIHTRDQNLYALLATDTVSRVYEVLARMRKEETRLKGLAESACTNLIFHLAIAVERVKKGAIVEEDPGLVNKLGTWDEYALAGKIRGEIEREFSIHMPDQELSYILLHLLGSKMAYHEAEAENRQFLFPEEDLLEMIDRMIDQFDTEMANSLKCDEEFIRGLIMHLQPAMFRMSEKMSIYNPVLPEIKREYPEIYAKSRRAAEVIRDKTAFEVSDDEIGFLSMHFGAAVERVRKREGKRRRVSIGIICSSGFGVAQLMIARLTRVFGQEAELSAYALSDLTEHVERRTDFFVTTFDWCADEIDSIRVSPLVPESDLEKIRNKIEEYAYVKRESENQVFDRQLDQANEMIIEIRGLIRRYCDYEADPKISFPDLVYQLADRVTESQAVAEEIAGEIQRREHLNSQIFPELDLALLHCRSRMIREPVFISCRPSGDRSFVDPDFKGIRAVIFMVMPEDEQLRTHMQILGQISASVIREEAFVGAILHGDEELVKKELKKILGEYFYDFLKNI